jgi:hypothetical protein
MFTVFQYQLSDGQIFAASHRSNTSSSERLNEALPYFLPLHYCNHFYSSFPLRSGLGALRIHDELSLLQQRSVQRSVHLCTWPACYNNQHIDSSAIFGSIWSPCALHALHCRSPLVDNVFLIFKSVIYAL